MIPLPHHPEPHTYRWTALELRAIEQWGREVEAAARRQALEEAHDTCERIAEGYRLRESQQWPEMKTDAQTGASDCEAAIRALIVKEATHG